MSLAGLQWVVPKPTAPPVAPAPLRWLRHSRMEMGRWVAWGPHSYSARGLQPWDHGPWESPGAGCRRHRTKLNTHPQVT